ncbi:MAG: hypothetical protein MUF54_14470 [Polyangiaceae bacterium]|nr:hypothetical protein [Polyangiaceae bacterium]
MSVPCRPHPEKPDKTICHPDPYESSFAWDGADNLVFRPVSDFLAVAPGGEAINVNAVDEVPDSSWFTNRIGREAMTVADVVAGPCAQGPALDPNAPDGSWVVDEGKANGANLGFRIKDASGQRYMLKTDDDVQPERASGATTISARLYHAAGWRAPCDTVVYFRPALLQLEPGLTVTDNTGVTRPLNQARLDQMLALAPKRNGLLRMVASRWLAGRPLGPFRYEGVRHDDPNDVIVHEDRRDLRGAKLLAAWVNHFDAREQNSMDVWLADREDDPSSAPGVVHHYYLDFGDCLGSEWEWEGISKRLGHAHYFDFGYTLEDFVTFGIVTRPWDEAKRSAQGDIFGFFNVEQFDAEKWRPGYPNPAFGRMTEHDGAWAARIIARFTPSQLRGIVQAADFTDPRHTEFIHRVLLGRQHRILQRYLAKLSPLSLFEMKGTSRLCATDLAWTSGAFSEAKFAYAAAVHRGAHAEFHGPIAVESGADGTLCMHLPHHAPDAGVPDDDAARYTILDVRNGQSRWPARVHLYDLGPKKGYRIVGLERPDSDEPPG